MKIDPKKAATTPCLTDIVEMVLIENSGSLRDKHYKPQSKWNWTPVLELLPAPLDVLEEQASSLTEEETETMATGEDSEQREIVKRKSVIALHTFLNEVFDGNLSCVVAK